MNLTSKSRYALKIMMDMVYHQSQVQRRDLSKRQGVPPDYLDQILMRLRRAGLLESTRGRSGGYHLAKKPQDITVYDVFCAVEDQLYPVECVVPASTCEFDISCIANKGWQLIFSSMQQSLSALTLDQLVDEKVALHHMCPIGGVRECRAGSSIEDMEKTLMTQITKKKPLVLEEVDYARN